MNGSPDVPVQGPVFYPDPLPPWVRDNHRLRAECSVYNALHAQLGFPWHVFYSRPWLGLDKDGMEREGEADFVLAHPEVGMLVIEVKGGTISYDPKEERWTSRRGDGFVYTIKNPVNQANRNKHALKDVLRADPRWHNRRINMAHGVIFPACAVPDRDLGAAYPRFLFAGAEDMDCLEPWIMRRMHHGAGESAPYDDLGEDGLDILIQHFAPSFTLERPAHVSLQSDDEAIRVLTDEQVQALDIFDDASRIAIPGPAGTGKTALAVAQAKRLARSGEQTLLLCFNRPLATQLQREVGEVHGLKVCTFHSLCAEVAARAGIALRRADGTANDERLFREEYPAALAEGLRKLPDQRYDAVLIDEGQDFPSSWFYSVEQLLRKPESSRLFVFYDDNQRVRPTSSTIAAHVPRGGVRLKRILRNGRQILEQLDPILPKPYTPATPDGLPVEWREAPATLRPDDVEKVLDDLIHVRRIRPEHIAVLLPDERYRERFVSHGRIGSWRVADAESEPRDRVICDTVRRFKGLERRVVVVVEPEDEIGGPELLYTALTRARVLLVLLGSRDRLKQIGLLLNRST